MDMKIINEQRQLYEMHDGERDFNVRRIWYGTLRLRFACGCWDETFARDEMGCG